VPVVARLAIEIAPAFDAWQVAARILLRQGVPPADVVWRERAGAPGPAIAEGPDPAIRVPRQFIELARRVAVHPDPGRWAALYAVLWRLVHGAPGLLGDAADPDVARVHRLDGEVARNAATAPGRPPAGPAAGQDTPPRGAVDFVPPGADIAGLRAAAARCEGCELHRHATRTVFSAGPQDARVVLVGEQPGDQEDLRGAPFVGPAGEVLDRVLVEVGLPRPQLYVTNVVKHFKFVPRGKRRIHQTPTAADVAACRPWLDAELACVGPEVLVCLGATACRALLGTDFRLTRDHGRFLATRWSPRTIGTLHPSAVLRGEDEAAQARLYAMLRDDLRLVAQAARRSTWATTSATEG
jgi:uracil-DNA glycosylase family protein